MHSNFDPDASNNLETTQQQLALNYINIGNHLNIFVNSGENIVDNILPVSIQIEEEKKAKFNDNLLTSNKTHKSKVIGTSAPGENITFLKRGTVTN